MLLLEKLRELVDCVASNLQRGLLIIHAPPDSIAPAVLIEELVERYKLKAIVFSSASTRARWRDTILKCVSPAKITKMLGTEWDVVVIDVGDIIMPNLVAAAAEMVHAPGLLVIVSRCEHEWDPGGYTGSGGYLRYMRSSLNEAQILARLDLCRNDVVEFRCEPGGYNKVWPLKPPEALLNRIPRALRELVATEDEARVLKAFLEFSRGWYRTLFVTGDRGRGKSASIGLGLAMLVLFKQVGVVTVTALTVEQVQSMFTLLVKALESLNIRFSVYKQGDIIYAVRGPWFHIRFHSVDQVYEPGPLLVVDEAAAVGPHRLRRLARLARRVIASTTIHGYEGSGRVLAEMVEKILPQPMLRVVMEQPVRYAPGDALEDWLYKTFVLRRPEWPSMDIDPRQVRVELYDGFTLSADVWLVRESFSVLSEAHYRNEPNDLALMLDEPSRIVFLLTHGASVLAVAEVALEWLQPPDKRMLTHLVLAHTTLQPKRLKVARIVRIAVRPELQHRGLGSMLLSRMEEELAKIGVDVIGAVYSRQEVTKFWLKNGYRVVYISPRFNKATGEKNIVVVKALRHGEAEELIADSEWNFRLRLLLSADSVYRDVPAEVLAWILTVKPLASKTPPLTLTEEQRARLERFVNGLIDHEAAWDAIKLAIVKLLSKDTLGGLPDREKVAFTARIVQGKPLTEVAALVGIDKQDALNFVDNAVRRFIRERIQQL